jgi:hypothetical protein
MIRYFHVSASGDMPCADKNLIDRMVTDIKLLWSCVLSQGCSFRSAMCSTSVPTYCTLKLEIEFRSHRYTGQLQLIQKFKFFCVLPDTSDAEPTARNIW